MMRRYLTLSSLILVFLLLTTGCSLFAEKVAGDESEDPGSDVKWLLVEDFSSSDLEERGWDLEFIGGSGGAIEIVPAPELDSGYALRVLGHPETNGVRVTKYFEHQDLANIKTIFIEHRFKPMNGTTAHVNIVGQGGHLVHWDVKPEDGKLQYRNATTHYEVGNILVGEWNVVRIVADRENNEVFVFLNDEELPVVAGDNFRTLPPSWVNSRFWIQHSKSESPAEVLYGDIKVWAD